MMFVLIDIHLLQTIAQKASVWSGGPLIWPVSKFLPPMQNPRLLHLLRVFQPMRVSNNSLPGLIRASWKTGEWTLSILIFSDAFAKHFATTTEVLIPQHQNKTKTYRVTRLCRCLGYIFLQLAPSLLLLGNLLSPYHSSIIMAKPKPMRAQS